ncbi:MAG: phage capsid protein [Burkholderiales bacterium RIFCSPHIGHO2_01_FULL_64_960]|uniref:recombination directionality factor n=1 Tax=Acidovorax sp. TaxID=1872122 RepID=UPI0008C5E994|nr:phage capsid protein [Acidovorax sp.]OGA60744.1 MAG: phage capsid protein [Burkholderiales bacterium RIFCSPHIGHO2_01_FULL_64_960]
MLKGLALTPPVIGRIAIGRVVEKAGRRLPEKDDEFTLTSQVQNKEGWVPHPVDAPLRKEPGAKLRSIPVRLLFDDPDLSLRANYTMFDRATGRPLCVGDGESCKRVTLSGMQSLPCPSPAVCALAQDGNCKPYGRLHVRVEADGGTEPGTAGDELGSFVFRTTGFNSIRTLSARLRYLFAVSGGLLAGLPLELRLRGKSTTLSHRTPIYYVDLTLRAGSNLAQVVALARQEREQQAALGLNQAALDEAARQGLALGEFEESEEEGIGVVEEFYPESDTDGDGAGASPQRTKDASGPISLRSKLNRRQEAMAARVPATGDPGAGHAAA